MGLGIGDSLSRLTQQPPLNGRGSGRATDAPAQSDEEPRPRSREAGFGANTLSPSNVALDAIDQTVDRAQDVVPSVEDLAQDFRDRFEFGTAIDDARINASEAATVGDIPQPELIRPEASPQVRAFEAQGNIPPTPREDADTDSREAAEGTPRRGDTPQSNGPRLDVFA